MGPDKSRLKPEKAPPWLQSGRAAFASPVQALLASICQDPGLDGRVFSPFDVMRVADQTRPVYHPWHLHGDHHGALSVADWLSQTRWSLPRVSMCRWWTPCSRLTCSNSPRG